MGFRAAQLSLIESGQKSGKWVSLGRDPHPDTAIQQSLSCTALCILN